MFKFLGHRNFILPLAFVLGLSCPQLAEWTKSLTIPALALVMTVSIVQIPTRQILKWQSLVKPLAVGVLFNYLFLGSLLLISSRWFIRSEVIRVGMILVASAPPGIAVIPFTSLLGGNLILSLLALFGTYLSAFLIMPSLIFSLTGAEGFPISRLFLALVELIILPVLFSRLLLFKDFYKSVLAWKGTIVNWGFFVVIFTVIGLNQKTFLTQPDILIKISLIALITAFLGFILLNILLKKMGINQKDRISMLLLGTIKNSGFAAAIALTLFDRMTSIPAAIISAVYAFYMIWLGGKEEKRLK
jgi:BASS family bile acid:Na+ symporter